MTAAPHEATWDCHVHVFAADAPLASPRAYTPAPAGADALAAHLRAHGIAHAVLVQPSPYGLDNCCVLAALDRLGPQHRAVVAVAPGIERAELDGLRRRGVRGLRFNPLGRIRAVDEDVRTAATALGRHAAEAGLTLEVNLAPGALAALSDALAATSATLVLPHFGGLLDPEADAAAMDALARLLDGGRLWVKASGIDRFVGPDLGARLARAAAFLAARAPERVLWGSDWPHTPLHDGSAIAFDAPPRPHRRVDVAVARGAIAAALGPRLWRAATLDNPWALYA